MKVVDAICEILKREGVEFLSCYPTNPLIEAAVLAKISSSSKTLQHFAVASGRNRVL